MLSCKPQRQFALSCQSVSKICIRFAGSTRTTHRSDLHKDGKIPTRFPTKFNPIRSAVKPGIILPKGLVYNPTPSPPTPYETPAAFLPKNDMRKVVKDAKDYNVDSMPRLSEEPAEPSNYHLSEADFIEIQRLRHEDPSKWTRSALAEKFKCSPYVISLASTPHPDRDAEMQRRLGVIKSIWDTKRSRARTDRQRRKQYWLRDAL
jgi:hypothetical protein